MKWRSVLKAKTKAQRDLAQWTREDWGTQTEHRAKDKGKTPKKEKTRGRYMPRATYKRTSKGTLDYQDKKKRKSVKAGKTTAPTGKKFSQKQDIEKFFRRKPKKATINAQKIIINGKEVPKEIAELAIGEARGAVTINAGGNHYDSIDQAILDKYMKDYEGAMRT